MFDRDAFLQYLLDMFPAMQNHFTYDTVENLVDYAKARKNISKDQLPSFLSDIIAEIEFGEVAMFMDDAMLTDLGQERKRAAIAAREARLKAAE